MANEDMQEIIDDFLTEANEILENLDRKFVELEASPGDDALLNDIFRSMHTIKGAAGFLGFNDIIEVAHKSENILNKLRQHEMRVTAVIMDGLLHAKDILVVLIEQIRNDNGSNSETEKDVRAVINELDSIESGSQGGDTIPGEACSSSPAPGGVASDSVNDNKASDDTEKTLPSSAPTATPDNTIRVDIKRLDDLLNMTGELVLGRNMLMRIVDKCEALYSSDAIMEKLKQAAYNLNLITTDLQVKVMKTRMQPISKVFGKFVRITRDLSRAKKKKVEIIVTGGETEMDKTVIEEIGDPLLHIIRNSIDHGIELPADRVKNGKPPSGTIRMSASQKGGNIIITIGDDGCGIDHDKIKEKALQNGLFTPSELDSMSGPEITDIIFHPGFSTSAKVTDVSGRGVGMDVVKTNINHLNGTIDVTSVVGKGTTITLTLPLTLAIIQSLILRIGDETYAIPLASVVEIVTTDDGNTRIQEVEGRDVVSSRGYLYPLVRLAEILGVDISNSASSSGSASVVVIVSVGERRYGLLVDSLLGQEEVVIKSMGRYMVGTRGISGATITGDGRVVLILDLPALLTFSARKVA